jgi:dolichyl-phosphate beta-glucosyltransferase
MRLSVIMPAYEESARLPGSLETIVAFLGGQDWDWELRVVDDGSTDDTLTIAREWAQREARVVAQAEPHRGKGGAVKAGMLATSADYRFICDVDLSMPIELLPRFLPPELEGVDVAIGSRQVAGAERSGEPPHRLLMSRVFNRLAQRAVVRGISDTQCGFKLFTGEAAELVFPRVTIDGWAFDVEVLHIAQRLGLVVREVPIVWVYAERSRISALRDSLRMFGEVLRIRKNGRTGLYDSPPELIPPRD